MNRPAIVIVTFKRQELLSQLLDSIEKSSVAPWRVVVVDNENSAATGDIVRGCTAFLEYLRRSGDI